MGIEGKVALITGAGQGIGRKATTFKADVTRRDDVYAAVDHAEKELCAAADGPISPGTPAHKYGPVPSHVH